MKTRRIIIADDHPIIRKGLKDILDEISDVEVADEVENGFDLLKKLENDSYDLIILDISMPGMSGLDAIRQIRALYGRVNILVFTIYSEEHYAIRFLKAGASGYVNKESDAIVIIEAINTALMGGMYYSKEILEKYVASKNRNFASSPHELLSNREYEVMLLIASGKRMTYIATELMISVKTVSTHKMRIFEKMNINSNSDLTQYASENNIL